MCFLAIYCFVFIDFVRHGAAGEKVASYVGAQVWRTDLKSEEDALYFTALAEEQAISIWNLNSKSVDFLIHAADQVKVNRVLRARDLNCSTIIEDVQLMIDELKPGPSLWNPKALRNGHRLDWNNYPRLNVIDEYLKHLANKYSSLVTLSTIGNSVENRPIKMVRISNGDKQNKAILMTAGLHAREWIAITSALFLIDTIVTKFIDLPSYMKNIDWSIIPVVNPDGYEYTHTTDRLWRKNRQRNKTACLGVDLNRNFGYDWFIPGLAQNSCDTFEQYSGFEPFSEPESRAIRDLVLTSKKLPEVFIDVHSYGQLIMYPWGSRPELPRNNKLLEATASEMSQAIFKATGENYITGNTYHTVYPTSGTQIDWFLSLGLNHSYVFEMRDKRGIGYAGRGFLLLPKHIKPTGRDLVAAMNKLAEVLEENIDFQNTKEQKQHYLTAKESNIENQVRKSAEKRNKEIHITRPGAEKINKYKELDKLSEENINKEEKILNESSGKTYKRKKHTKGSAEKMKEENRHRKESTVKANKKGQLVKEAAKKTTIKNQIAKESARKTKKEKRLTKKSAGTMMDREKQSIDTVERKTNKQITYKELEPGEDTEDFSINVSVTLNVEKGIMVS